MCESVLICVSLSATKEAIDDYRRYMRDKKANTRPYEVIRNGRRRTVFYNSIIIYALVINIYFIKNERLHQKK